MHVPSNLTDIAERAGWTGVQGALGLVITDLAGISAWWAAPLALALSAVKTYTLGLAAARKVSPMQKGQTGG